ncbi:DUF4132 domain-containing protein [Microbispora sp. NBC_01189]|uniref:WGR and DUF4132 domain-containing protein n=1 Tax=Microbispora sp. NBC_01189 TaxID=2903583 RepID=UPI002E13CDE8|nr:DUF4132 domain-containing protein [Microbispora sp. NBC_01189]
MSADRMLTYVGGGSAKFWEVRQDGTELNIRYGRLGATGQTQVKSFGSAAAATVAADKLVAEKLRKGYTEDEAAAAPVTSPTVTSPAETSPVATAPAGIGDAEDEDRLTMPAAWLRALHPRRGGVKVTVKRPDPGAPGELAARVDGQRQLIRDSLAECSDPEIAAAGAAHLAGEPSPLGAAVVAQMVAASLPWNERTSLALFAEAWLAERGPVFAATAVTELASLGLQASGHIWPVRRLAAGESLNHWYGRPWLEIASRVRAVLSAVPDAEYAEVVAALAASREDGLHQRVAASYLAPIEAEWVADDCAEVSRVNPDIALELVAAVSTPEHAALIASHVQGYYVMRSLALPATLVDGIGTAAVPVLAGWYDDLYDVESRRRLLGVLAELPSDAAMRAILDRIEHKHAESALLRAAARFPRRAMRMLATSGGTSGGKVVETLLRAHVLAHPGLVDEVLASVDDAAAGRINKITAAPPVPVAPLEVLPEVLVSPPWTRPRKARKPVVVSDLVCTDEPAVVWRPGERDTWSAALPEHRSWDRPRREWKKVASRIAEQIAAGRQTPSYAYDESALFAGGPEELAAPLIERWRPGDLWGVSDWMPQVAARFGPAALPMMLDSARRAPVQIAPLLLPFAAPEIAVLMAEWLARLRSVRATALAWLARHPETAARALIPAALGKPGVARRQAEQALAVLAAGDGREAVTDAAAGYGPAAEAAVADLLAADPLDALPARMPMLPEWAEVAVFTPVQLRGGAGVLPPEAVRHVMTMLAISRLGDPYAGLTLVKEACDSRGLADLGWALFQRWQGAGYPSKESWVMDALALIGDDETIRRLTPLIRTWPGDGGHSRAVAGLDLLAAIGSDVALMHLHGIAEKVKFTGLKNRARQKMNEVAADLGLTPQELADRLVPDFGLAADGSLTLDYGRRRFVVGFDEQLKPYVTDAAGKRLKNLPKPGANDDPELAPAAYQRFTGLKKDVRAVAADSIHRLEQAMVNRRRWTGADFRRLLVGHPLLWHIVRRLVWGLYDSSGRLTGALRVAEDRSFADVEDDALTLPDEAVVGVAHPLELGAERAAWAEVFADYEILQPFPQLGRETYGPDETLLAEIMAARVPTGRVLGLERRGWRRGYPQDAGWQGWIERDVPGGGTVTVGLDPGVVIGYPEFADEQTLTGVSLDGLDPITVSEILRDLREITR